MRILLLAIICAGIAEASPIEDFIRSAGEKHGTAGEKAARYLADHMPARDKETLTAEFLINNLDLAFQTRAGFPWAKSVPEEIFLNDVLPYAVLDETREAWRADFMEKAKPLVKDARTASEAAQALNRGFFKLIRVHYDTGRKAPNQSPGESMASGRATCTGLSIILIDACRAVGIPARAVGTPMWTNGRGNHTWVEIWDDGWRFTGADEYDPKGLDRGWFTGDAARAKADEPGHAIYASSWKNEGLSFPLPWAANHRDVAAVNVTDRYAKPGKDGATAGLGVRLVDRKGGSRLAARVRVITGSPEISKDAQTKAGTADLNDMARFSLKPGSTGRLVFTLGDDSRELAFGPLPAGDSTVDAVWSDLPPCAPARSGVR